MEPKWYPNGANMGPRVTWALLARFRALLGASWAHLGGLLGALWGLSGSLGRTLGVIWALFGALGCTFGVIWPLFGVFWTNVWACFLGNVIFIEC
jgi:hypothetical protein